MEVYPYTYVVTTIPPGCTTYTVESQVTMYVPEPPPESIVIGGTSPCAGTRMELVADE